MSEQMEDRATLEGLDVIEIHPAAAPESLFLRRLRYIARFVLWTLRHGSTEHVRWVLAHEGTSWN